MAAEIVQDIDLRDDKFNRPETPGIDHLIAGLAMPTRRTRHGSLTARLPSRACTAISRGRIHEVDDPIEAPGEPHSHRLDQPSLRSFRHGDPLRRS